MSATATPSPLRVLVYSDDPAVRAGVRSAVGVEPAADVTDLTWVECATHTEVLAAADGGGVDLAVLDGEAWPAGGLGLAKQMKDELRDCPQTLVLIARRDDAWLASWSLADAVLAFPADAAELAAAVADRLRARRDGLPVRRASGR